MGFTVVLFWLVVKHPIIALTIVCAFVALCIWLLPKMFRLVRRQNYVVGRHPLSLGRREIIQQDRFPHPFFRRGPFRPRRTFTRLDPQAVQLQHGQADCIPSGSRRGRIIRLDRRKAVHAFQVGHDERAERQPTAHPPRAAAQRAVSMSWPQSRSGIRQHLLGLARCELVEISQVVGMMEAR